MSNCTNRIRSPLDNRKNQYISDDMLERGNRYQTESYKFYTTCTLLYQETRVPFFYMSKYMKPIQQVFFQIDTEGLFIITVLYQMKMIFTVPMSLMNLKKNVLTNSQLQAHVELSIHLWVCINQTPSQGQGYGVLMEHSTIFQLYHFCQFYWWR